MNKILNIKIKRILSLTLAVAISIATTAVPIQVQAAKKGSSSTYAVGDDVAFGYLDGELINWTILTYDDTTKMALVVSRKTLTSYSVRTFRKQVNDLYLAAKTGTGYVQWSNNLWRNWLNQSFYKECFSKSERAMIKETTLSAKDNQKSIMNFYHDTTLDANYLANKVKNSLNMAIYNNQSTSKDYVFFLSYDEYVANKDNMKYEEIALWPLRTNAYDDPAQGLYVNDKTKNIERGFFYQGTGIRPAMYVQLGEPETTDTDSTDTKSDKSSTKTSSTDTKASASTTSTKTAETTTKTTKKKSYANNATEIGSITLPDDSKYTLRNGGSAQVALNLNQLNSTDKDYTVTYKSSDASVFTVDSKGEITAVGSGTSTLTAKMKKSNGKVYSMSCRIDVT